MAATVVLFSLLCVLTPSVIGIEVSTKYGTLKGLTVPFPNATGAFKAVDVFLGVPFAAPPVGKRRFQAPEAPSPWKPSVYDATKFKSPCLQGSSMTAIFKAVNPAFSGYNEDCLFLDIYAPSVKPAQVFPVMVYIHGGSYSSGGSSVFGSHLLALHGVVVVVIQYRLNLFGFMTSGDSNAPGNYGMLDQIQALTWVKENIDAFGGNPSRVTIFGESAGATSVSLLILSPLATGLFQQAIAESGVDFSPFAVSTKSDGASYAKAVAAEVGCSVEDTRDMVECMRDKRASELLNATIALNSMSSKGIILAPVVDNNFLPDTPKTLRKEGKFAKVKFMISFNRDDGSTSLPFVLEPLGVNVSKGVESKQFQAFMKWFASAMHGDTKSAALIADAMEFQYTPWPETADPSALRQQLVNLFTDLTYSAPSHAVAAIHSHFAPVYMYEFNRRPNGISSPEWMGVRHADNVGYDFGIPLLKYPPSEFLPAYDDVDRNISLLVMTLYSNFARSGNPTPQAVSGVSWEQFNSTHRAYLKIDEKSEMASNYHPHRVAFWTNYYPKLAQLKLDKDSHVTSAGIQARGALWIIPIILGTVMMFVV